MNLALFFEGTGQGVRGKKTNVSLVNAETCPEFVTGPGTLEAVSDSGALLIVR